MICNCELIIILPVRNDSNVVIIYNELVTCERLICEEIFLAHGFPVTEVTKMKKKNKPIKYMFVL